MRKLLTAVTIVSLIAGCSSPSKNTSEAVSKNGPVCTMETPLAKVGSEPITVAYYKGTESSIPKWAIRRYYSGENGAEKLLQKIIDRQLIVLDAKENGFFEKPKIKKTIDNFRIEQLAYGYLNSKVGNIAVSDKEVQDAIQKYYKGKKVTPQMEKTIRINLEAQKFQSRRNQVLEAVEKKIKFNQEKSYNPDDVIATYNGTTVYYKDVEPLLTKNPSKNELQREVKFYILSKLAVTAGLNRKEDFSVPYRRLMEDLAVKDFEDRITSKVKVTDNDIKSYYEKHKSELRTPEQADVGIFVFSSKDKAKKALSAIEKGKSLKEAIPKDVYATYRAWKVTAADVSKNPISALVFKEKSKNANILVMPNGTTLLITVKKRYPSKVLAYGDAYSEIKSILTAHESMELANKMVDKLRKKYGVKVFKNNLKCVE